MAKPITDTVSAQLYGDQEMQDQILSLITESGFSVAVKSEKDYVTKKDESGHYRSITVTT